MLFFFFFFAFFFFFFVIWSKVGLNNIYSVIEIIRIQKYTLSCKTGSDKKRNAYMPVISCKFRERYNVKNNDRYTNVEIVSTNYVQGLLE